MSVLDPNDPRANEIRRQLSSLARQPGRRTVEFSRKAPTRWQTLQVINPETGFPFSDAGAWELIADQIDSGVKIESFELDKPPGATGYKCLINIDPKRRPIYVKLQLGAGVVIGRSFHYSN